MQIAITNKDEKLTVSMHGCNKEEIAAKYPDGTWQYFPDFECLTVEFSEQLTIKFFT